MIDAFLTGLPFFLTSVVGAALLMASISLTVAERKWLRVAGYTALVTFALGFTVLVGFSVEQKEERREALEDCGCLEGMESDAG